MSEAAGGRQIRRSEWWAIWMMAGMAAVLVVITCGGFLFPWSEFNCWHEDVDLQTGRKRTTWYLCFVPVLTQVEESSFSLALGPAIENVPAPNWQRVNTFSPGVNYSPHYRFHAAFGQMANAEMMWNYGRFSPEARRKSAQRVLDLWQKGPSPRAAEQYLQAIVEISAEAADANRVTVASDLPD